MEKEVSKMKRLKTLQIADRFNVHGGELKRYCEVAQAQLEQDLKRQKKAQRKTPLVSKVELTRGRREK